MSHHLQNRYCQLLPGNYRMVNSDHSLPDFYLIAYRSRWQDYDLGGYFFYKITTRNMITCSTDHADQLPDTDQIFKIAGCLADNFLKALYQSSNKKSYSVYVDCMEVLINWSYEFYCQHCSDEKDKEAIRKAMEADRFPQEDFLVAWGSRRIEQYIAQRTENKTA